MDEIHLSHQEVIDIVLSILEAVDFVEGTEDVLRYSWTDEMRDWCLVLLNRLYDDGGEPTK